MPYADPEAQRAYQRDWIARRRQSYLKDKACLECGTTENLELDHIDPTQKVDHRVWSWSQKRRNDELAKCRVLCRTHHQAVTPEAQPQICKHGFLGVRKCSDCRREWKRNYMRRVRATDPRRWR